MSNSNSQTNKKPIIDSLGKGYDHFRNSPSSISRHFETVRKYAAQCKHITELGCNDMVSCWALAKGLADHGANVCSLTCVDIKAVPDSFEQVSNLIKRAGIRIKYVQGDSLKLRIQPSDLLFVDTFHSYPQLKRELEKHHSYVSKYIVIPNTEIDGETSEIVRLFHMFDIDEQCMKLNACTHEEICIGMMPAINEFVANNNSTWRIAESVSAHEGLIVLERI